MLSQWIHWILSSAIFIACLAIVFPSLVGVRIPKGANLEDLWKEIRVEWKSGLDEPDDLARDWRDLKDTVATVVAKAAEDLRTLPRRLLG